MSKKDCHSGNPLVFKTGDIKVYAGGTNREGGWHRMTPAPQLAMGPIGVIRSAKTRDILPEGWTSSNMVTGGATPIVMEIDWPDYGIPNNLKANWWKALVQDIKDKNITSISTQCMGGHGRTGVQLAILAHLLIPEDKHEWKDANELISWIRSQYCTHAVESKSQQTYIADVCGIPEGASAISVSANPWANTNFDATAMFTEDEIKQAEADRKRAEAQEKENSNRKKHQGVKWQGHPPGAGSKHKGKPKGKPKVTYDSPIKKGWSLTFCTDCGNYEWRKTSEVDMEWPCRKCGSTNVMPVDAELMNGDNLVLCYETEMHWHPIEMYTRNRSFKAEILSRGMKIKESRDGFYEVLVGSTWWPSYFLTEDDAGDIVPVHRVYNEMRKMEKESMPKPKKGKKGKQKKITDDFDDTPPHLLDDWSSVDDPYEDEPFANKHQDILSQYRDKLDERRRTNEEIEAED